MTAQETLELIQNALEAIRVPGVYGEYDLHDLIKRALTDAGLDFVHEARLGPRRRVDFLVGSVVIEVKRGVPDRRLILAQLQRYAEIDAIEGLIVVSSRRLSLPDSVCGKRVVSFGVNRLWGVALP